MTLHQLHAVKLWHVAHKLESPIEFHVWDSVLTAWVMGWMGEPAALLLQWHGLAVICALLFFAPSLYVGWRRRLHRAGRVRCDWLDSLGR
jgi:hypothetical protein